MLLSSTALVAANPLGTTLNFNLDNEVFTSLIAKRQSGGDTTAACQSKLQAACTPGQQAACYQAACSYECIVDDAEGKRCCSESGKDLTALETCLVKLFPQNSTTATGSAGPTGAANATRAGTTAAPTSKPTGPSTGSNTTSPNAGERIGGGGAVQLGMAGTAFAWALSLLLL
jgi:hypothetical protein